jgi:hypothetical protein
LRREAEFREAAAGFADTVLPPSHPPVRIATVIEALRTERGEIEPRLRDAVLISVKR